jgi:hypothetical protein
MKIISESQSIELEEITMLSIRIIKLLTQHIELTKIISPVLFQSLG